MGATSSFSNKFQKFSETDYPLIVRIIDRHVVVTSPDFNFPVPVVVPYEDHASAGRALRMAWLQITELLKLGAEKGERPPTPINHAEVFPRQSQEVSLSEACRITGLKPTMLRELGDQGIIASRRTPKGHRRFSRKAVEVYAERIKADFNNR